MTNIYDVIYELYNDDEGWNTVLERRYAEQFLRTEAFRGATDDELLEIWQQDSLRSWPLFFTTVISLAPC